MGLFGNESDPALDAYRRSMIGTGWPGFWLEAPLGGSAGMDLHVAYGREQLDPDDRFAPGAGFGYQKLFDWYTQKKPGGNGLALDHDLGNGKSENPGVAVNVNGAPLSDPGGFFTAAGAPQMGKPVQELIRRLPEGFYPWYLGWMPNRPGCPGRVDCFLARSWREQCAEDPHAFETLLDGLGFAAIHAGMLACIREIARIPLEWEIQMDVLEDGSLLPNLTLSMVLPVRGRTSARELFSEKGPAAEAMALLEGFGAADSRWRLIPDATVARLVPVPVPEEEPVPVIMAVLPKFIKMKWNQGQLQTAKVYYAGRTEPVLDDGNMDRTRRGC